MTTDERNFRSSYYEKVGCHSVEEKKNIEKLLMDNNRNHAKLKQFCLSYSVPQSHRLLLWECILGILPLNRNSTAYIIEQRRAVYEDLLRAVTVMQHTDHTTTKSRVLLTMWMLENNRLLHVSPGTEEDDNNFVEIVEVLLKIFDNEVESYWIAKEFCIYTKELQAECTKLKELTQMLLKREDILLHKHLEKLGVFGEKAALDKWYITCFAGVIRESALVKIWDKVCGGSRKIVVFLFLELAKTYRDAILNSSAQKELKSIVEQVKDQDAAIVNKAIKTWQSNKNHSEITLLL